MIVPALTDLIVDIASVTINPANTRRHMPNGIDLLKRSLHTYGQHKPIVVQRQGMLCRAGNGLLQAALELGWTKIAAVIIDEDNVTATAREIADNRTAEIGSEWDQDTLLSQLHALQTQGYDIATTGWTEEEVQALQVEFEDRDRAAVDMPDVSMGRIIVSVPQGDVATIKDAIEQLLKTESVEYTIA